MAWTSEQMGQAGLGIASQVGGFIAASIQAKSDRRWQKYNNKMVALQAAMQNNVITTNENIKREALADQKVTIAVSEYKTLASAHVAAAASGTVGRSVSLAEKQISKNASAATNRIEQTFKYEQITNDEARRNTAMNMQTSLDLKKIRGPSPIALALGIASSLEPLTRETY